MFIKTNKVNIFDVPLVYFQNPKLPFNRIYDVRVFSPDCVPKDKNALYVEFTCAKGDDIWKMSDQQLFDIVMRELESKGLLRRDQVEGFFSKQVSHAYPCFKIGFQDNLQSIFGFLSELPNTITLGRQGLFCYANVDEVLHMSFRIVDYVHTIDYKPLDYYSLFNEFIS